MSDLLIVLLLGAIVAVAGVGIGMLVASRLARLTEPDDEEPVDGQD
jgi:hypothetical protein